MLCLPVHLFGEIEPWSLSNRTRVQKPGSSNAVMCHGRSTRIRAAGGGGEKGVPMQMAPKGVAEVGVSVCVIVRLMESERGNPA